MIERGTARLLFILCGAAALLLATGPAAGGVLEPGLEDVLEASRPGDRIPVIARLDGRLEPAPSKRAAPGPTWRADLIRALHERFATSRAPVFGLLERRGVDDVVELWAINGLAVTATPDVIREIAELSGVVRVSLDETVAAPPKAKAAAEAEPEWNLDAIRASELWALGHTGAGVVVASMDTGVDETHPDLAASYRGGDSSWFDPHGEHEDPHDRSGHGTQAMGVMVGGAAGGTAIGVAPDAQWIAVKIFNDAGESSYSAIHQGYQWLLDPDDDPDTDDAPDVVNNSWSLSNIGTCTLEFEEDLQMLRAAGVAVVFSAGNYGSSAGTSVSPANNPSGFGVGFVNSSDTIHVSSSRGPSACDGTVYPELVAPGVNVRTADLGAYWTWVSGASIAAPHASGAMALLLSAHPDATVAQLERALEASAVDLGALGPDETYGHGRIDLVVAEQVLGYLVAGATAVTTYTDEGTFLADLTDFATVAEGFEDDGAWGASRSPDAQPSVTSQGITWASNHAANQITTGEGAARSGSWGVYSTPHGDQDVPNPTDIITDGLSASSDEPLAAVGGWITGTSGGNLVVILDGDEANPISLGPVDAVHRFYGVKVDDSFSSFEFRETEGTLEDQKYIFVDDVSMALAGAGVAPSMDGVVAGVGNLPGALGSDWHTDLFLHNASDAPIDVELYFSPAGDTVGLPEAATVGPDETLALEDAVASVFGEQGSGAIFWRVVVGDPDGLLVNANTYNRVDAIRRYGQQVPGVRWGDAAPAGTRLLVPALAGRYRTNLGFATDGDCSAVVIRGYDRSSRLAAQRTIGVQPWSWVQLNSLFRRVFPDLVDDPDREPEADSLHRFEILGVDGRVVGYTSIVDNATSDGSYMVGQVPGVAGSQWLPGAAVVSGAQSSEWRSDVVAISTAGAPGSAEFAFFPSGPGGGTPDQRSVELAISESRFLGNILVDLFGYSPPAVGSLEVSSVGAQPLLWMRTYTEEPGDDGGTVTYGQAILPRTGAATVVPGAEGRIAGFTHDANTRANLTLQNTRSGAGGFALFTEVRVELLAADGSLLHQQTYLLDPGEYRQLNRFVDRYGTGPVQHASVRVIVLDPPDPGVTGGVDAMVSEVNGNTAAGTNDSRLLRAEVVPQGGAAKGEIQ